MQLPKPVELCCFLLNPEAFNSYEIDYSHVGDNRVLLPASMSRYSQLRDENRALFSLDDLLRAQ